MGFQVGETVMQKFSDDERKRIREQLIQTGRELLLTYGPKKTTVNDITEPVGIAKPTFYQFFDAKSDLYLEILEREMEDYVADVRSELEGVEDPQDALEQFFWCYVEFGEENPLIQQTIIKGEYRDFIGNASQETLSEMQQEQWAEFVPLIEDLQERSDGPISSMDPLLFSGLMSASLGWLMVHKDEYEKYESRLEGIGADYYENIQKTLITVLAKGLTAEE